MFGTFQPSIHNPPQAWDVLSACLFCKGDSSCGLFLSARWTLGDEKPAAIYRKTLLPARMLLLRA
jgi:hypothetical protein